MRNIFILVFSFLFFGCYGNGDGEDDMGIYKPLEWGQTKKIEPAQWQRDKPITVVERAAEYSGDSIHVSGVKNPFVKNLTLGVSYAPGLSGNFALRWVVTFGVGGGSENFQLDACDLQQLALSADQIRVSIMPTYRGIVDGTGTPIGIPFNYSNPSVPIDVAAFYAEGMTATDSPTLTQAFNFGNQGGGNPNLGNIPIPKFASSFRLLGDPAASTPFSSSQFYSLVDPTGSIVDGYTGDEIFGVRLAPIPTGSASVLVITNTDVANAASGSIEWSLDL